MSLPDYLNDPKWDSPIFKLLPINDTGAAAGHQGGMLIPIDLRPYFPDLTGDTDEEHPTVDHRIDAILCVDCVEVARVETRYQMQTWGATRSPETRVTDNLGKMRNSANKDDILLIQRYLADLNLYRFTLIRKGFHYYDDIVRLTSGNRWGTIGTLPPPVSDNEIEAAHQEEQEREAVEFSLFDDDARVAETRSLKIARSAAFKVNVMKAYNYTCSITGESAQTPTGLYELEAAHIVPRSRLGSDDVRNGLALSRRWHWAFDRGMFGFDENRRIFVPKRVRDISENKPLADYHGEPLKEATFTSQRASQDALDWHRDNIMLATEN